MHNHFQSTVWSAIRIRINMWPQQTNSYKLLLPGYNKLLFSCYYFYRWTCLLCDNSWFLSASCLRLLDHALFRCLVNLRCCVLNPALWHCFCLHCDLKHNLFFIFSQTSPVFYCECYNCCNTCIELSVLESSNRTSLLFLLVKTPFSFEV